jgi:hypothetical protein
MPAAPIAAGAGLLGSFLQSNSSKNAQKADMSQQSALDNQMIQIYNNMMGKYNQVFGAVNPIGALNQAKNFYTSEVQGGLSPATIGAANSEFQQQNALNLSTLENQLGPYTPNMSGMIKDFQNNEILGNVSLQQQLAGMNQGVRQQGAAGLAGIGQDVLNWGNQTAGMVSSGLGGLASQFGAAGAANAQNAWANNPFSSIANLFAMNPNAFNFNTNQQPGQGGLGATGGLGGSQGGSGGAGGSGVGS